jgi:hypothetical protein
MGAIVLVDSEQARELTPAFGRIVTPPKGGGRYEPLGVSIVKPARRIFNLKSLDPEEPVVSSYATASRAFVGAFPDGDTEKAAKFEQLFDGMGAIAITTKRLVGVIEDGNSALGPLRGNDWLLYSLPLTDTWDVKIDEHATRKGTIKLLGYSPIFVVELYALVGRISAGRSRAKNREVATEIVRTACDLRMSEPIDSDELARLEALKTAPWDGAGPDIAASLRLPDP